MAAKEDQATSPLRENTGIPLYVQVVDALSAKVTGGQYMPGQKIPPESQLCREFGVSRITIRQAVRKLVDQRVLYTKQGKGTYVHAVKIRRKLPRLYSFSEDMQELGFEPSSRTLEQAVIEADDEVTGMLSLAPAERSVNLIVRVRMANRVPILLERSYIPLSLCPDLLRKGYDHASLYRTLTERYRLELIRAEETYEVRMPTAAEANELLCARHQPVFAIQRIAYRKDGLPVEMTRSVGRGDLLRFTAQLTAHELSFTRNVVNLKGKE